MWDELTLVFQGDEETHKTRYHSLVRQYETLFFLKDESLADTYTRFKYLISQLASVGLVKSNEVNVHQLKNLMHQKILIIHGEQVNLLFFQRPCLI